MSCNQNCKQSDSKNVIDNERGTSIIFGQEYRSIDGISEIKYERLYSQDIKSISDFAFVKQNDTFISYKSCEFIAFCLSVYPQNISFAIISSNLAKKLNFRMLVQKSNGELINLDGQVYMVNMIIESSNRKFFSKSCKWIFEFIKRTQGGYGFAQDIELSNWLESMVKKTNMIIDGLYYLHN